MRLLNSDPTPNTLKSLQSNQNRMLRAINGSKISDRISTESMLMKFGLLSVNQLCAKIKLIEIWKSQNNEDYPIKLDPYRPTTSIIHLHDTRVQPNRVFNDSCKLKKSESSFHMDSARLWNASPPEIRLAANISLAKTATHKFCKTLPV